MRDAARARGARLLMAALLTGASIARGGVARDRHRRVDAGAAAARSRSSLRSLGCALMLRGGRSKAEPTVFNSEQDEIVWEMLQGNREYVRQRKEAALDNGGHSHEYLQYLQEDGGGALRQVKVKALIISCARSFAPMDHIFGTNPREIQVVRGCGYACSVADSVIGSIEFELADTTPPVLMIVGNTGNEVVASTVRRVARASGLDLKGSPNDVSARDDSLADSVLLNLIEPCASRCDT